MRSSERARDLGEVFTPEATVNEMLNLLQDINYASKFLEPGCGSGNFLVEILSRKIEMVSRLPEVSTSLKSGRISEFEFKCVVALASIYGVDIDPLNIEEARERLVEVFNEKYKTLTKKDVPDYLSATINHVLEMNILLGDLVNAPEKVEVIEYSELPNQRIKQRVFKFSDLIFPEDEVFEDNNMLFGHVPVALRDLPLMSYTEMGMKSAD
jgi:SAM-dependent methyltransferase